MAYSLNTPTGARTERKKLITIATWSEGSGSSATTHSCILGARTEDSSIEFNADIEQVTDILGATYTDVNKTQPKQSFDPAYIIGGEELQTHIAHCMVANDFTKLNGTFDVYVVEAYLSETTTGESPTAKYFTAKHTGCSIIPQSIGGESYVSVPYDVYFSNVITTGYVSSLAKTDLLGIAENFTADA